MLLPLETVVGTAWRQLHDCGPFSQKEGTQDITPFFLQLKGCWFVLMFWVSSYLSTEAQSFCQQSHRQSVDSSRRSSKQQRLGWTAAPCARTGKSLQKGLLWSSKPHFLPMGRKLDPSSWRLVEIRGQEMDTQLGQTVWRMVLYSVLGLGVKMWFFERNLRPKFCHIASWYSWHS